MSLNTFLHTCWLSVCLLWRNTRLILRSSLFLHFHLLLVSVFYTVAAVSGNIYVLPSLRLKSPADYLNFILEVTSPQEYNTLNNFTQKAEENNLFGVVPLFMQLQCVSLQDELSGVPLMFSHE